MADQSKPTYEFGRFLLDASERVLLRDGQPVALTPKAFDTLLILVQNGGHVLEKDELMKAVWPDSFVEEVNLAHNISVLRKALQEKDEESRFIETVPRRGYRFVAPLKDRTRTGTFTLLAERTRSTMLVEEEVLNAKLSDDDEFMSAERTSDKIPYSAESVGLIRRVASRKYGVVIALCSILVGITALVSYIAVPHNPQQAAHLRIKSVAVLPFRPLDANSSDESLEMGVTEALITKLSSIRDIIVRPVGSVSKYAHSAQDAVSAGLEQRVDAVLVGTIQKDADRIRVTARFTSARDGSGLWTDKFDRKFTNIFSVQDGIAERIADALALKLSGNEKELLAKHYTENSDAYQLYVKGRYLFHQRNPEGIRKSIEFFEKAIGIDANYALAYSALADSYNMLYVYTGSIDDPEGYGQKTKAAAMRALELDDTLAEAHTSFGKYKENFLDDIAGALDEYRRAIQLYGNYALARFWNSRLLGAVGQLDEALAEAKQAQNLDPVTMMNNVNVGQLLYYARRYDEAILELKEASRLDPKDARPYRILAEIYTGQGMFAAAMESYEKAARERPSTDYNTRGLLAYIYAAWGKRTEAERALVELERLSKLGYDVGLGRFVFAYAALGQKDKAFEWLEKAVIQEDSGTQFMKVDPKLDPLRSDQRFARLLQRRHLPE